MHTLLCGQRRYTLPAVVVPANSNFVGILPGGWKKFSITNIKPPSGLVITNQIYQSNGPPTRLLRFTMDNGNKVVVPMPAVTTLFLSDGIISEIEWNDVDEGNFSWWLVADVAYLAEVRNAYGKG